MGYILKNTLYQERTLTNTGSLEIVITNNTNLEFIGLKEPIRPLKNTKSLGQERSYELFIHINFLCLLYLFSSILSSL